MYVDGSCHCGKIQYEAEVNPAHVVVCHCTDCQALSGTAFRVVVATTAGGFRVLRGELKTYVKVGESGKPREQTFCCDCGSPIYSAAPGPPPKIVSLRIGTIRQRAELIPSKQDWHRSSMPWLAQLGSIDKTATQPVFDDTGGFVRD
jgi:hypothetical protein